MPSAKVTVANNEQPEKAELPILVTDTGIVMDGSEAHLPKASAFLSQLLRLTTKHSVVVQG